MKRYPLHSCFQTYMVKEFTLHFIVYKMLSKLHCLVSKIYCVTNQNKPDNRKWHRVSHHVSMGPHSKTITIIICKQRPIELQRRLVISFDWNLGFLHQKCSTFCYKCQNILYSLIRITGILTMPLQLFLLGNLRQNESVFYFWFIKCSVLSRNKY